MFISILHGQRSLDIIIAFFKGFTWISYMCGAIDDTHIKLTQKHEVALVTRDDWIT
jgi:hypothetical protein